MNSATVQTKAAVEMQRLPAISFGKQIAPFMLSEDKLSK